MKKVEGYYRAYLLETPNLELILYWNGEEFLTYGHTRTILPNELSRVSREPIKLDTEPGDILDATAWLES